MTNTQRYKLTIAYRGTAYHGWQAQPLLDAYSGPAPLPGEGTPTIQETVARTLAELVDHPINLVGSSRTDAGVHAKGQIAHFDTQKTQIPPPNLRRALNHRLPADILVREIDAVPDTFDAIRSTVSKRYQYFIWNHPERPVFFSDMAWHRWQPLDVDAMHAAAQHFIGEHDFASFARPGHGRAHTTRTVYHADVTRRGPRIVIGVEGRGFLWNQVRIMVGTLAHVGIGRIKPEEIVQIREAKDREAAGPTAPSHGLYLQWIRSRVEPPDGGAAGEGASIGAPRLTVNADVRVRTPGVDVTDPAARVMAGAAPTRAATS